jgi:hypothetical protein
MAMETVFNFVRRSGFQNFGIRVAQSGDRAEFAAVIPIGTDSIIGALVVVLE